MAARIYATIGRAPDNNVVLDHPTVSNHHARLSWSGASLVVEDLSSANGTFVDGQRVKTAKTRPGAEVVIGQVALPWSHEGLKALLKAGVGARTLVMAAAGQQSAPSFVCGGCGHVGVLPPGPVPSTLSCPMCKANLRTGTKPRGTGKSALVAFFSVLLLGAGGAWVGMRYMENKGKGTLLSAAASNTDSATQTPDDIAQRIGSATAKKLAAAIDPMDPTTRNTAVKIAARTEGPFHVEQVAEIWAAVRQPWRYVNDPEGREYFATAKETIENGYVGDCDDFAIALASMVISIGGKARIVLMDGPNGGHAYTEACVQGDPAAVATALIKHYKNRFKRYITGKVPTEIAFRTSEDCPIWLNLDWNSSVPGGAYEPERWAIAVNEDGSTQTLAPANPPAEAQDTQSPQHTTRANEPL